VDLKEIDGECGPGLADGFGFMSKMPSLVVAVVRVRMEACFNTTASALNSI